MMMGDHVVDIAQVSYTFHTHLLTHSAADVASQIFKLMGPAAAAAVGMLKLIGVMMCVRSSYLRQ